MKGRPSPTPSRAANATPVVIGLRPGQLGSHQLPTHHLHSPLGHEEEGCQTGDWGPHNEPDPSGLATLEGRPLSQRGWLDPTAERADTGPGSLGSVREEGSEEAAWTPGSNRVTAGGHLVLGQSLSRGPETGPGPQPPSGSPSRAEMPGRPQPAPASPVLPPGPGPAQKQQQHLLQIQVPGEVERASLRLMQVPGHIAVTGKRGTQ